MLVIDGYSNICFFLQVNKPSVVFIDEIDALATRYDSIILYYEQCALFVCTGIFTCLVEIMNLSHPHYSTLSEMTLQS